MTGKRVEEATRLFLAEYPDLETAVETLLAQQRETGSWGFDDAPLDSGQFGELVSREFVKKTDDGEYQFIDSSAVESGLSGEAGATTAQAADTTVDISLPTVNRRVAAALVGALALTAAVRLLYYSTVFRDGNVISPANDPYFYRYYQELFLEQSSGITDLSLLTAVGEQTTKRPLTHALNWWFAELSGGSAEAASTVAAWQPVVFALVSAVVLYALVVRLTADTRVALAALVFLALTPVHAVYTSLGFLEHRSYQYLWLLLTVFALVWLAVDFRRRLSRHDSDSGTGVTGARAAAGAHIRATRTWGVVALLAFGVATSVHSWGGSPLTFVPVAAYFALRAVTDVDRGVPPVLANIPALAGIGAGTVLAAFAHVQFGWQGTVAVATPALVTAGGAGVLLLARLCQHRQLSPKTLVVLESVLAVVGTVAVVQFTPGLVSRIQGRADDLFGRTGITETTSLFTPDQGIILEPVAQIGFGFYLGFVSLLLLSWVATRRYSPGWLVVICFAWSYLLLAGVQVRFAAQLSLFLALFAGLALVYLLATLDLARPLEVFNDDAPTARLTPSLPDRQQTGYLVVVIVFILLLNLLFVPSLLGQIQYSGETFEATTTIETHHDSIQYDHPEYVLSQWSDNRMYNYFVNGNSSGYNYALNFHERLISRQNPDEQYRTIHSGRVGYVVVTDTDAPENTTHYKLYEEFGAGNESVAHYQLIHSADDIRAFALVEGAVINVTASPGETVTARTNVTTAGESFTYERTETATESGTVEIRVAYPGEYEVGETTVTVTEEDIYARRKP